MKRAYSVRSGKSTMQFRPPLQMLSALQTGATQGPERGLLPALRTFAQPGRFGLQTPNSLSSHGPSTLGRSVDVVETRAADAQLAPRRAISPASQRQCDSQGDAYSTHEHDVGAQDCGHTNFRCAGRMQSIGCEVSQSRNRAEFNIRT